MLGQPGKFSKLYWTFLKIVRAISLYELLLIQKRYLQSSSNAVQKDFLTASSLKCIRTQLGTSARFSEHLSQSLHIPSKAWSMWIVLVLFLTPFLTPISAASVPCMLGATAPAQDIEPRVSRVVLGLGAESFPSGLFHFRRVLDGEELIHRIRFLLELPVDVGNNAIDYDVTCQHSFSTAHFSFGCRLTTTNNHYGGQNGRADSIIYISTLHTMALYLAVCVPNLPACWCLWRSDGMHLGNISQRSCW